MSAGAVRRERPVEMGNIPVKIQVKNSVVYKRWDGDGRPFALGSEHPLKISSHLFISNFSCLLMSSYVLIS